MSKSNFVNELEKWTDGDPARDAILIKETPIKASTLLQLKSGHYNPSDLMITALRGIMARFPLKQEGSGPEAA